MINAISNGRMSGKTVIFTGGAGDLGAACIDVLIREGARVANLDLTPGTDRENLRGFAVDITDSDAVRSAVDRIIAEMGAPDVLVNAAGILGRAAPSHESTEEEFDRIFRINVKGTWLMTKYVVPHMIARRSGSIINFSSIHGLTGGRSVPLYHATKGAVRLLTKADAATYGEYGIRVNSVHPGSINTRMSRESAEMSPLGVEAYYRQLVMNNPLPHQGKPEDIAHGVLFLASDESAFSTGSELVIDGGYTAL